MLKKAGIVVATVAAGLLAVSPLAFAGDYKSDDNGDDNGDKKHHHKKHKKDKDADCDQDNSVDNDADAPNGDFNLLNLTNTTVQVNPQVCGNQVASGIAAGILGKASALAENG